MRSIHYRADLAVLLSLVIGLTPALGNKDCSVTSTGLIPLTDLGAQLYLGHEGGLYSGGANGVPADHLELGLDLAALVGPRDEQGNSEREGAIGLISIGVSNTMREFRRFIEVAGADPRINPQLVFVNGAQRGQGLDEWSRGSDATPWLNLAVEVAGAGVTSEQVQVAWIKVTDRNRGTPNLDEVEMEIDRLAEVARIAKDLYPNLTLTFVSSRTYGGYGGDRRSEPNAYQNGFAVKMLIERQIEGDPELNADPDAGSVLAPWLAWGPYLWADGVVSRSDGLVWECDDFDDDGIHPVGGAINKVADLLMEHFSTAVTSVGWFLGDGSSSSEQETITSSTSTGNSAAPPTSRGEGNPTEDTFRGPQSRPTREGSRAAVDLQWDVPWLVAGVVVGFGVSLTLVAFVASRQQRTSNVRQSEDLDG